MTVRLKTKSLYIFAFLAATHNANADELETITVTAPRIYPDSETTLLGMPMPKNQLPASIATISEQAIEERQPDRLEDLSYQIGLLPSTSNAGLSTALNARGFDLTGRLSYNGHPDILRMFVRDMATVERVEVWKGQLSLLYGQGAPGATVNYVGKRPHSSGEQRVSASLDSFGQKRLVADIDSAPNDARLNYRLIYAGQTGDSFIDNVNNDRQTLYGAFAWNYGKDNALRLELEGQRNERPFSFGTVYANGRFQYDRYYVGPQAKSDRRYRRAGLYWDHALSEGWGLHGAFSNAEISRDERLVGFWTIKNPTTLSSYYRTLTDHTEQQNSLVELRGDLQLGGIRHRPSFGLSRDTQRIDFYGPQNIGGFNISIANPSFDVDLGALPMQTRFQRENSVETGAFAFDRLSFGEQWHLLAGVRKSGIRIDSITDRGGGIATDVNNTTASWGVTYTPEAGRAYYLSRTESFEPNRGMDRFGRFIPPKEARQYEIGMHAQDRSGANQLHLALFDIEQSNLTTTDPLDHTALIAVGTIRSTGLEIEGRKTLGGDFALSGQIGLQRVRNVQKTSAGLGSELPGVPNRFGAVTLERKLYSDWPGKLWATLAMVGKSWGDTSNTFTAPGYGRFDLGASWRLSKNSDLVLLAANVFDKHYVEAITDADNVYQGERRRLAATIRHSF